MTLCLMSPKKPQSLTEDGSINSTSKTPSQHGRLSDSPIFFRRGFIETHKAHANSWKIESAWLPEVNMSPSKSSVFVDTACFRFFLFHPLKMALLLQIVIAHAPFILCILYTSVTQLITHDMGVAFPSGYQKSSQKIFTQRLCTL